MKNWLRLTNICTLGAVLSLSVSGALGMAQASDPNLTPQSVVETRLRRFDRSDTKREAILRSMFTESGCDQIIEQHVESVKQPNLICVMPGSEDGTIIVGAHFDHAEIGSGVIDNWSGASLLPSLFETLKHRSRKHTYIFIGFCAEERGEIGSKFYVKNLTAKQIKDVQAMVNLDTLGLGPTEVWASHADPVLLQDLGVVARNIGLPVTGVNVEAVGTTDSEAFRDQRIPAITIHTLTQKNFPLLHSVNDQLKEINLSEYYKSYRLIAAYLEYLDETLPAAAPTNAK
jgi:hypothetical protein